MVQTYTTKNGLRIVLESVPHVRSVTMGIWVLTGSRNETEHNNGISHFIEHMLFKGTKTRSAQEIAESFDSIGGHVNAFTSKEYTCYYSRVLDSHKEYALEVLTDMFFNSLFLKEELEREKKVVLEEIKMYEDTPDDLVHELLAKAYFGDHPLGRPIIGTEEQINRFTKETIVDYMEEFYRPSNIVVSIAGNVDETFIKTVEDLFAPLKASTQEDNNIVKPELQYDTIIRNKDTEQAHLCLGFNGLAAGDENIPALLIANSAFGGGMSSRLFQEVREKRGLAYSVYSYHSTYLDTGRLTIYAGTNKEQLPLLTETIDATIDELVTKGLSEKELKNNKEQLKGNILLSLESTNSRMSRNARNELLLRRHRSLDDIIAEIDMVSNEQISHIVEKIFTKQFAKAIVTPK